MSGMTNTTAPLTIGTESTTSKIDFIDVTYTKVLNGSVRCYAYIEGKKGRVQVVKDGTVNITGRFSNAELSAMFAAILSQS